MNSFVVRQPQFGRSLRELRIQRGLSQRDLATGVVNPSYISLLESGSRVPTLDVVIQLSQVLDVPLRQLIVSDPVSLVEPDVSDLMWQILAGSATDFGDLAAARQRIETAYAQSRRRGQAERIVEVGLALRQVLALTGDHTAELELLDGMLPAAESIQAPAVLVKLKIDYAAAARSAGRYADARRSAEAALAEIAATDLRDTTEHVRLYGLLVAVLCDTGDTPAVPGLLDTMFAIAETIHSPAVSGRVNWAAATAYARLGQPDRVAGHLRKAREMLASPTTSVRDWAHFSRAAASVLIDAAGDAEDIAEYLASAQAAAWVTNDALERVQVDALRARYELDFGDAAQAVEIATPLLEPRPRLSGYDLLRLRVTLGRALARIGRRDDAVAQLRAAAEFGEDLGAYRMASGIWRELDQLRSGPRPPAAAEPTRLTRSRRPSRGESSASPSSTGSPAHARPG